jgi:TonB family protein
VALLHAVPFFISGLDFKKTTKEEISPISFGIEFSRPSLAKRDVVVNKITNHDGVSSKDSVEEQDSSLVEYHIGSENNPSPKYPNIARQNKWQGTSGICVRVSSSGQVESANICESSGYAVLDMAAKSAIENWKFTIIKQIKSHYDLKINIDFVLV